MTLRNKIKTGITALILGSTLAFSACKKESKEKEISNENPMTIQGTVVHEETGMLLRGPFRMYQIKDSKGKKHGAVIYGFHPDPFNKGDCARVKLGNKAIYQNGNYYKNGMFVEEGHWIARHIVEYEFCKK